MNRSMYFESTNINWADFFETFHKQGFAVIQGVLNREQINRSKEQLISCISLEADRKGTVDYKDYGMLPACPIYGGAFLEVADHRLLMEPFNRELGDGCIIYVYTSSSLPPSRGNYATRIHVDRPHFIPGFTEAMGCLVLLDDFTEENGATWVLAGSHLQPDAPDDAYFYRHATRILAPSGSVFYFHLRLWHAGGVNRTDQWRHALGIGLVRGYMKQRIDLPRAMTEVDISGVSDFGLQKLGYFAQPPTSLEEYYATPEKRTFRQISEWDAS